VVKDTSLISLANVTRTYRLDGATTITPICDVNLDVQRGEFLMIVGRSGSGKTTLLNLCLGLVKPTSGQVMFNGEDIQELSDRQVSALRRERIGFVFQFQSLLPNLNIIENVALPAVDSGTAQKDALQRAAELLGMVGLSEREKVYPRQLSAGELRRVAIGRALMNRPELLLADEPTADLDETTEASIVSLLKKVHESGITVVMITHNLDLVRHATRALKVEGGRLIPVDVAGSGSMRSGVEEGEQPDTSPAAATAPDAPAVEAAVKPASSRPLSPARRSSRRFVIAGLALAGAVLAGVVLTLLVTGFFGSAPSGTPGQGPPPIGSVLPSPAGGDPLPGSITLNALAAMKRYDVVAAKLTALMAFEFTGTTMEFPADFSVLLVPIVWTDTAFSGVRESKNEGVEIKYAVNGEVSPDGTRLVNLVFSRTVMQRETVGSFYRVTVQDLPLSEVAEQISTGVGILEKTGADLQKNVTKVEYSDGQRVVGQTDSLTSHISTNWESDNPVPALKLTFGKAGTAKDEAAAH